MIDEAAGRRAAEINAVLRRGGLLEIDPRFLSSTLQVRANRIRRRAARRAEKLQQESARVARLRALADDDRRRASLAGMMQTAPATARHRGRKSYGVPTIAYGDKRRTVAPKPDLVAESPTEAFGSLLLRHGRVAP